jgi:hypothetical protein
VEDRSNPLLQESQELIEDLFHDRSSALNHDSNIGEQRANGSWVPAERNMHPKMWRARNS